MRIESGIKMWNSFSTVCSFWKLIRCFSCLTSQVSAKIAQYVSLFVSSGNTEVSTEHNGLGVDSNRDCHFPPVH